MKLKYWSCSKFADWLRGTPKPFSGTAEEWNAWGKKAKVKKFRYWLTEEGLDYLESIVYWPKCRLNDLRRYINNRYIVKTHALTSCLKRGEWYEFDTRLYHYELAYSYDWNAMRGFHLLMRLAHAVNAISEFTKELKKYIKSLGCSATLKSIKETVFNPWLPLEWYELQQVKPIRLKLQLE